MRYDYRDYDSGTYDDDFSVCCVSFVCRGDLKNAIYNLAKINDSFLYDYYYFNDMSENFATEFHENKDNLFDDICDLYNSTGSDYLTNGFIELQMTK